MCDQTPPGYGLYSRSTTKKIPGVGRVTQAKLQQLKLETLGDLQHIDEAVLIHHFGKYGKQLYLYAQGIDHRVVQSERVRRQISRKPLSIKTCTSVNVTSTGDYWLKKSGYRCNTNNCRHVVSVSSLKHQIFRSSGSKSFKRALASLEEFQHALGVLLTEMQLQPAAQYRLIGVGVYQLGPRESDSQLSFW